MSQSTQEDVDRLSALLSAVRGEAQRYAGVEGTGIRNALNDAAALIENTVKVGIAMLPSPKIAEAATEPVAG